MKSDQKSWASPFIAVTFVAVSITGILMMFHLKLPGVYPIHQWGGCLFILAGAFHLLLNWREFVSYFRNNLAISSTLIGILALILIAVFLPSHEHENGHHNHLKRSYNYEANH